MICYINSGELGSRNDGAKPICNRRATSNDVTSFSSIEYSSFSLKQKSIYGSQDLDIYMIYLVKAFLVLNLGLYC
ncbi:MAG: palindromic element RPE2 domain-containing protein [Rickettsia endosymbiont of Culicoides impunctatus]|uniref:palindromic element RPE2 domain-containing protein n=1 Tax=unclassified Candidatus Tisiphia TaxID=2996318 RepID=UPI001E812C60|nr:palindromic element RPE2 domain-containing protein [Rickettsia endosymbiont of Platyusa sonomae]MCC8416043.1 palindromic element RPE2 domain-containing protein [Rickettsia endosymbiont of Gnoriste bilineata]UCM86170.1 MAG: palindromic element RPE2 domain-containing protein [Rickettsia endosymbiont of Culicoides impunctatus]